MKKQYIWIVLFLILIGTPYFSWGIMGKYSQNENNENRYLAEKPKFSRETWKVFSKEYEEYINDYLPYRNQIISINSTINYKLFKSSMDDRVILGKNGWLFYNDGNSINDYKGLNLFTEKELEWLANDLMKKKEKYAEAGCEFVIFYAPNKERMYLEYMPDYYGKPAEEFPLKQLVEYLRSNTDIRIVYPYEELKTAKETLGEKRLLYYKTDTHWNDLGAYIGTMALLKELGVKGIDTIISVEDIVEKKEDIKCDLTDMLGLRNVIDVGKAYTVHELNVKDINLANGGKEYARELDARRVYMYRDSFGEAMVPVLEKYFDDVDIGYKYPEIEDVIKHDIDIFVLEFVERGAKGRLLFDMER